MKPAAPTLLDTVRCFRIAVLLFAAASAIFLCAAAARFARDDSVSALSGRALVKRLDDPATRARAFHELSMRGDAGRATDFEDFAKSHRNIELVVCPQGAGRAPIYLLLYDFLPEFTFDQTRAYPVPDPDTLFPPQRDTPTPLKREPAIDAFTAAGRPIAPFGGNNVLEGTLADINRDGRIERIETTRYGVDGVDTAEVLHVWAVETKARPIFSVLINWGAAEWGYRLRDQDGDGIAEIEIGPRADDRFSPQVAFVWNARDRTYRGPAGSNGDHFRVLDPDSEKTGAELKALRAAGLAFPADSSTPRPQQGDPAPLASAPRPSDARPSGNLDDTELLRLMGSGPNAYERERDAIVKNQLPSDFWALAPKVAALALAELNRSQEHRRRFRLTIDDRDGAAPPASGSFELTSASSRCYVASDAHYFLRFSPEDSYLAYARSASGGAVFYNIVSDRPSIDLRLCPLPYERARHLAATLWWLDRVRSRDARSDPGRFGAGFSTADGFAELNLRNDRGALLIEKSGMCWAAELSERWSENYAPETFVNFATWLVSHAFVEHLGEAWTRGAPPPAPIAAMRKEPAPFYSPEQLGEIVTLSGRFLALAAQTPPRLSPAVASVAAEAVGDLALADAAPALRSLLKSLPTADAPAPSDAPVKTDWIKVLREQSAEALRKIETVQDVDALQRWAEAHQPGGQWALRQLAELDPARYARLLETWLAAAERAREGRQLFQELARVAPARATELARTLPPERRRAIVPADILLRSAAGENEGVAALLAVLLDPASGWQQRREAIDVLVPAAQPLRHAQPEVDAALLRALEPGMADDTINFTRAAASRALALRGRTEHFDRIGEFFRNERDAVIADELIAPLALLAQAEPERLKPRLAALIAPHLVSTNRRMSEILWAIWAADLREFKPRLEQLSTSGPDEYEDGRAVTSGGEVSPVTGRFHLARNITGLWNERDALTRARLLAAFALRQPYEFTADAHPERIFQLRATLADATRPLDPAQRSRLESSFATLLTAPVKEDIASAEESRRSLATILRTALVAP